MTAKKKTGKTHNKPAVATAASILGKPSGNSRRNGQVKIKAEWQIEKTFLPVMPVNEAKAIQERWLKAVQRAKNWEK